MRIAVITFHNTMNFGASLQCAALSRYLSSIGGQVEVIDYLPYYVMDKKSSLKELKKARSVRGFVKGVAYLYAFCSIKAKDEKISEFLNENVTLTRTYHSFDELRSDPPIADVYVCGSDQVWNPNLTGDSFDESFFLRFVNHDAKKVAYGVSVGELNIEDVSDELKIITEDFDHISVRESSVCQRLSSVLEKDVSVVLDPTLLLEKAEYAAMERSCDTTPGKYLLLYTVQNSDTAVKTAKRIAAEKGLYLVDISPNPFQRIPSAKKILDIGPGEYLTLIKNSEHVVTNSFHGTVFSIVYEKDFNSVLHATRGERIRDLLRSLDLSDRIMINSDEINTSEIKYGRVKEKLSALREYSNRFIQESILSNK